MRRMKKTMEMASMILDGMPMPNHMMNRGARATRGREYTPMR
jgi:hypothetical protein